MSKDGKLENKKTRVFEVLKKVPFGRVVTYGVLAKRCGVLNPRSIGWILGKNINPNDIPCYKVVLSSGRLAGGYKFGGPRAQKKRLEAEGIILNRSGRIEDFEKILWS